MKTNRHKQRMPVRRGGRRAIIALTAAAAGVLAAAPAHAASYRVYSCKTPSGKATSTAGWSESAFASGPGQWVGQDCANDGALHIFMSGDGWPGNTWKAWTWTAPAGTSIANAAVRYDVSDAIAGDGPTVGPGWWLFKDGTAFDATHVVRTCISRWGCTNSNGLVNVAGPASSFGVVAGCLGDPAGWCAGGNRFDARLFYAAIDLNDANDPTVSNVSGTALETRSLSGSETLAWTATDQGGGIYQSEVKIGTTVVAARSTVDTNSGQCATIEGGFGAPVPCKLSASQTMSVDTTKVADGTYTLVATVWDAAGNASTIASRRITIDNVPPPAIKPAPGDDPDRNKPKVLGPPTVGAQLTAFDGAWTDVSAQITREWQSSDSLNGPWTTITGAVATTYRPSALMSGKYLRLAITATSKEGTGTATSTPVFVDPQSGGNLDLLSANNGAGGDPSSGRLVPAKKRTKAKVGFKRTLRVAGKLLDAAGKPIAGGSIDVYETVAGGARTKVATITSDVRGRYSWSPATRSNRLVELQYSRQKGSDQYQSGQSLQVLVRAGVNVKLARRHIPPQGRGVLRGRVLVDGFPTDGVWVEIRTTVRGRDQVIGTARTDAAGRFRWSHKFAAKFGYVPLRVRVRGDRNMPALPSTSRTVRLLIG
jgi:5-hydroxyisourate hydrolase-like protein (transthyretin family)